jgi:signal peptidase
MKTLLKVLEWAGTIILGALVISTAFMVLAPKFGLQMHSVMSGSMEPAMKPGGMVVCKSTPVDQVSIGDIIGLASEGKEITHRVIDISEKDGQLWFQTKGDANDSPDADPVSPNGPTVERVVYHIPYLGFVAVFMKSRLAFLLFICIPALALLFLLCKDFFSGVREVREKAKARSRRRQYSKGALVERVVPQSPADKAGLKPGDIIVAIDDVPVTSMQQLNLELRRRRIGDQVVIEHYRGHEKKRATAVLERKPESPNSSNN